MPAAIPHQPRDLFIEFLDVCNKALAENRESFPYKQVLAVFEDFFADKNVAVQIYDEEPSEPVETVTIRLHDRTFEPVARGEHDLAFRLSVKRDYMRKVVKDRQEYIDHPEKLDWHWLKSRVGMGGIEQR